MTRGRGGGVVMNITQSPSKKTQASHNTPRNSPFSPVAAFLLFACHRSPTLHAAHAVL